MCRTALAMRAAFGVGGRWHVCLAVVMRQPWRSPVEALTPHTCLRVSGQTYSLLLTLIMHPDPTSGDLELFEAAAPCLDVMGKARFFLGPVGAGANMKLVVNM